MTDLNEISDETLTAYLDGALSQRETEEVEYALKKHAPVKDRLLALTLPMDSLRDGANLSLHAAPALPDLSAAPARKRGRLAAGLIAACAIGVIIGTFLTRPAEQNWIESVANYQSLYVEQTLARAQTQTQAQAALQELSQPIGIDLTTLLEIEPLDYRRAQLLGFEGHPLVQVAYLDKDVPIAICITPRGGADSAIQNDAYFGLQAASWQKDGLGFLVIGGQDADLILKIAEQVKNKI